MNSTCRFLFPFLLPVLLFVSCRQSPPDVRKEDKKHLSGVWLNKTVLDAACKQGPYFDSTLFWSATQLIIDSNQPNVCIMVNDDLEQTPFALRYEKNRILLFEPGFTDSIILQYNREKDCLIMHDLMAKTDFEFVRGSEKTDAFKKQLRSCWLSGNYSATWGSFRDMDNGSGKITFTDNGQINGWDKANRYDVFINGDYASFADHPLMALYKDSTEELYIWNKRGDTIELFNPVTLYNAGEKPYYGKGSSRALLIREK